MLEIDHVERRAAPISAKRQVDLPFVRREDTVHHRDVALPHLALSKLAFNAVMEKTDGGVVYTQVAAQAVSST